MSDELLSELEQAAREDGGLNQVDADVLIGEVRRLRESARTPPDVEWLAEVAWEKFFRESGWATISVRWASLPEWEKNWWRVVVRAVLTGAPAPAKVADAERLTDIALATWRDVQHLSNTRTMLNLVVRAVLAGAAGWRDISTAPKDVDLVADVWTYCSATNSSERHTDCRRSGSRWFDYGGNVLEWGHLDSDGEPHYRKVTHWMPLPPAPERKE